VPGNVVKELQVVGVGDHGEPVKVLRRRGNGRRAEKQGGLALRCSWGASPRPVPPERRARAAIRQHDAGQIAPRRRSPLPSPGRRAPATSSQGASTSPPAKPTGPGVAGARRPGPGRQNGVHAQPFGSTTQGKSLRGRRSRLHLPGRRAPATSSPGVSAGNDSIHPLRARRVARHPFRQAIDLALARAKIQRRGRRLQRRTVRP